MTDVNGQFLDANRPGATVTRLTGAPICGRPCSLARQKFCDPQTKAPLTLESAALLYLSGCSPGCATHAVIGTLRPTERRRATNQERDPCSCAYHYMEL